MIISEFDTTPHGVISPLIVIIVSRTTFETLRRAITKKICSHIYDMCKAVDKNMVMSEIKLIKKTKV